MNRVAFLFPGQGSQKVAMGQILAQTEPAARDLYAEADEILGFPLSTLCFKGPDDILTDTLNAQPAILTTSIAILRALEQRSDLRPAFVAGHSLGEFTALVSAGVLSFADGLRLVRERGRLMKAAGEREPGGMAAILGMEATAVAEICALAREKRGQPVQIANDNCPGQIVISGARAALEEAMALAEEKGARRVVPLQVSIASHSPLMEPAALKFEPLVAALALKQPATPVVGNTTARPLADAAAIRAELVSQLTSTVRWKESILYLQEQGVDAFIEIGPKDVLTGLMKRIDRKARRISVQDGDGISRLLAKGGA